MSSIAVATGALLGIVALPLSGGAFTARTVDTGNQVGSAASFAWGQVDAGASPVNFSSTGNADYTSLADVAGIPYVSWNEYDGTNWEVRVARLNAAGTGWTQVVGGASPVNQSPTRDARFTNLASVAGVPHVAWIEFDGVVNQVRVARLNAAGNDWVELVGGASPINYSPSRSASVPRIASVGGVAHVAWEEHDGTNTEIRVSRLNAAGTDWVEVVGGVSPINHAPGQNAADPSLVNVGGIPWVAWYEADGTNTEIRVARLAGGGTDWVEVVGGASPVNRSPSLGGVDPSLVPIEGVPHVAWKESDGVRGQIRVARLNAAGADWVEVVGGPSPINHVATQPADNPHMTAHRGRPWVAWSESDGTNLEIRVARLNTAGDDFVAVGSGPSPVNAQPGRNADRPSLIVVDDRPYMSWQEDDGVNTEARVSRYGP